jgi:hypothetical protein
MLNQLERHTRRCSAVLILAMAAGCSQPQPVGLKRLEPGAKTAGFLSSYSNLTPNPELENTFSYVKHDDVKNVHKYFAMIVEPVQIYVATNADLSKMPDRGRVALAAYFQNAVTRAVSDAFPIVQEPGPLVLRLRTALIGIHVGAETGEKAGDALERGIDLGKVAMEMEMVDSMTGEQIMAEVDRQNLGEGATVGSVRFSQDEKSAAAKEAFDGWAARLRAFLDSAEELTPAEVDRVESSYRPYGELVQAKK